MRRLIWPLLAAFIICASLTAAYSTDVKSLIGLQDLQLDSDNQSHGTFQRRISTSGTITLDKIDGNGIPWSNAYTRTIRPLNITGNGAGTITGYIISMDNVSITGGTIDNTVIGGTTSAAGTFSSLTATSDATIPDAITMGSNVVTGSKLIYTDNVTSDIQAQINLKAPAASPSFTGTATFSGEIVTTQLTTTGGDNTHFVNVANYGNPDNTATGNCYYSLTTLGWLCYNGSSWAGAAATTIAWDNITSKAALPQTKDFVIKGYAVGDNNMLLWKADQAQTLTQLDCMTGGTDNVTITLHECNSSGAACSTTGLTVKATSAGTADSSASNGSIDADDWVRVLVESIEGTATHVACTVRYTVAMP